MPSFTDQMGRTILLPQAPRRIISLVPSQTELLYTLDASVVGITKFCTRPEEWFHSKTRVGGTKNIHPETIDSLQPDLIIANKEENDQKQIEDLATKYPVWISDIQTLPDALNMIRSVGDLVDRPQQARDLATRIRQSFNTLPQVPTAHPASLTAYLIWRNPWMAAGSDTFINDMLHRCGLGNAFPGRYPEILPKDLEKCRYILLSSEPYPFKEKHIEELQNLAPDSTILLVDGELFSWYGSRLLESPAYFAQLRQQLQTEKYPQ